MGREIGEKVERPSRDETSMYVAQVIAERGTCSRLKVGAVITRDGRILSTGYNGPPSGMPHCKHTEDEPCEASVHAEANAIAFAARHGVRVEGAELHTTHSPCLTCAKLIVNAGLTRVVYGRKFRDMEGLLLLKQAGLQVD